MLAFVRYVIVTTTVLAAVILLYATVEQWGESGFFRTAVSGSAS
ncbi:hypothetical protein [Trinickia violacea]|nr:hypothetical protein [Trinickia violacea]